MDYILVIMHAGKPKKHANDTNSTISGQKTWQMRDRKYNIQN